MIVLEKILTLVMKGFMCYCKIKAIHVRDYFISKLTIQARIMWIKTKPKLFSVNWKGPMI